MTTKTRTEIEAPRRPTSGRHSRTLRDRRCRRWRARAAHVLPGLLLAALCSTSCSREEPLAPAPAPRDAVPEARHQAAPDVAAGAPDREEVPFEDRQDLLEAIEHHEFAERVGGEETFEVVPSVPDPVEISFVSGTEVPASQMPKVEGIADALVEHRKLGVDLVGCSDPSGPAALNLRISTSRAESVAARLRELGVAEEQIGQVEGRGEDCRVQKRLVRVTPKLRSTGAAASTGSS